MYVLWIVNSCHMRVSHHQVWCASCKFIFFRFFSAAGVWHGCDGEPRPSAAHPADQRTHVAYARHKERRQERGQDRSELWQSVEDVGRRDGQEWQSAGKLWFYRACSFIVWDVNIKLLLLLLLVFSAQRQVLSHRRLVSLSCAFSFSFA